MSAVDHAESRFAYLRKNEKSAVYPPSSYGLLRNIHADNVITHANGVMSLKWSGCRDSNPGPLAPEASALPGCATPRQVEKLKR